MGSISRMSRSQRFIEEFNEDAKRVYAPGPEGQKVFCAWGIGFNEHTEQVELYWTAKLDGKELDFVPSQVSVFFDPEEQDEDLVERVMDMFELDRETATQRLLKIELIHGESPKEVK
jgi:hypothetical protein